jgi:hypothetical protein
VEAAGDTVARSPGVVPSMSATLKTEVLSGVDGAVFPHDPVGGALADLGLHRAA